MNRRDFLKGALITSAALSAGGVTAGEYEHENGKGLNRLSNRETPSVMEQKHVPLIEAPNRAEQGEWFNVNIKVGFMKEHPSTPGHWIRKIKLLVNRKEVAETEYREGGMSASTASYRIRLEKTSTLEAVENCNLHGTWISDEVTITVA